ncbi:hypothetical protein [Aeromonas veronii]|uniref:hypothetical protein n=1 Tax=Aeromonas veronii TaxID=654 RepID=UPI003D1D0D1C
MVGVFKSEVFYKSERLCVGLNKPIESFRDGYIFITFDGLPGGFSLSGFGTEFLAKNGYISLHVTCEKNTSYQYVSSDEIIYALSDYIENKTVFLYGSSVGGYAALYFSSDLKGTAISFSPLCPPDPVLDGAFKSGSEQPFFHTCLIKKNNSYSTGQFIVYDPLIKYDSLYFNKRVDKGFPNANVYMVPNGQHSVAKTLLNNGCLKDFFFSIVNNFCFPTGIEIDTLKNSVSFGKKALNLIREGDCEGAYKIIKKYGGYGVSRYSETALRRLFFDKEYNFTSYELDITKYRKNLHFRSEVVRSALPSVAFENSCFFIDLASVFIYVFDFDAARSVIFLGLAFYPSDENLNNMLAKVEEFISRVK